MIFRKKDVWHEQNLPKNIVNLLKTCIAVRFLLLLRKLTPGPCIIAPAILANVGGCTLKLKVFTVSLKL